MDGGKGTQTFGVFFQATGNALIGEVI